MNEGKKNILKELGGKYGVLLKELEELEEELDTKKEELDELADFRIEEDEYGDILDDTNDLIHIGNLEYDPSEVLKAVDKIAYDIGLSDESEYQKDTKIEEVEEEIEDLESDIKNKKEEIEEFENV